MIKKARENEMNKGKNKKMMRDKFGFSDEEDDFDEDEEMEYQGLPVTIRSL